MSFPALLPARRYALLAALASLVVASVPADARAQSATAFQACTQGSLANCALIQLTSGKDYGQSYFEIMIHNLGTSTGFPTSIDFLSFAAGGQDLGAGVPDVDVTPSVFGDATLTNSSAWDVFVGSDAIFLSALSNHGVGGCVAGADVNGFGQAGQTCADDSFLAFKFFTPRLYDPFAITLLDMEVTQLTDPLSAEFCSDTGTCTITPAAVAVTPEPSTVLFALTGFAAVGAFRLRRRRAQS
jgi:hypothetical protein